MVRVSKRVAAALLAVTFTSPALGQGEVPAVPAPPTLWSFLGIPQGVKKVQGALTNRRGNLPRLEPKDAIKALNDPANLESPNPAIKRAAEIKKAEDLKPQKIKAIKYLTSIGCGCYDKDGSVTQALVAAAEDCTEDVRLATMEAVGEAAKGKCCANCGEVCCCNEDMLKKLAQIAYERDDHGCYLEPSARVREAAAAALAACCPGQVPLEVLATEPAEPPPQPEPIPEPEAEKSDVEVIPEQERTLNAPEVEAAEPLPSSPPPPLPRPPVTSYQPRGGQVPAPSAQSTGGYPADVTLSFSDRLRMRQAYPTSRPAHQDVHLQLSDQPSSGHSPGAAPQATPFQTVGHQRSVPDGIARMRRVLAANPPQTSASPNPAGGVVLAFDHITHTAYVHFEDHDLVVPIGATLYLRPDPRRGSGFHGTWQVVESAAGCANLQPLDREGLSHVQVGDHANFGSPEVVVAPISYVAE